MFSTDRLRFRAHQASDLDQVLALFNNPLVATYLTEGPIVPRHFDKLEGIRSFARDSVMFCIVEELASDAFIGFTAVLPQDHPKNREANFGIGILPSFWSKGYGFEIGKFMVDYAFRHLASHRVSLTVFEGNDRAIALYKKIGFVEEGRIRNAVWIDGGWRDRIHMGILEEEWAALKTPMPLFAGENSGELM
ncbi:hypothetical protein C0991_006369 [Blastosporella zonata]|nr:hypothetical protein C0991_006369 [Blastosporella zonata]